NGMIDMVNERLRAEAIQESRQSIEYLNKELQAAHDIELQRAIYRLIETQVNNAMLANVQRAYAFRAIAPAVPPPMKVAPERVLLVAFGTLLGLFLAVVVLFVRYVSLDRVDTPGHAT